MMAKFETKYARPRSITWITLAIITTILLLMAWGISKAQAPAKSEQKPTDAPRVLTEAQQEHIEIAIKDWQLLQESAQQLQEKIAAANQEVNKHVDDVRKQLGVDSSWNYNMQTKQMEKTKPAEPAKTPAVPTPGASNK